MGQAAAQRNPRATAPASSVSFRGTPKLNQKHNPSVQSVANSCHACFCLSVLRCCLYLYATRSWCKSVRCNLFAVQEVDAGVFFCGVLLASWLGISSALNGHYAINNHFDCRRRAVGCCSFRFDLKLCRAVLLKLDSATTRLVCRSLSVY